MKYQFSIYYSLQGKGPNDKTHDVIKWIDERKRMRKWNENNF